MKSSKYSFLEKIKKFNKIAIFRHIHPDFDAIGSSFALKNIISLNFKNKEIKILGDNNDDFIKNKLCVKSDTASKKWFSEPFLAIILDTANKSRISDRRWEMAEYKIKIDHHPFVEKIGDEEYIDSSATSTSEILADLTKKLNLKINKNIAEFLYIGIAGDSGRFKYKSTNPKTFSVAKKLLESGIDLNSIYSRMYLRNLNDIKIMSFILNRYVVYKRKIIYYIIYDKDLNELKINVNKGKEFVNMFSSIKNIKIWCSITEDISEQCFRVSIRSNNVKINDVAEKWNGGGHENASGSKIFDIKRDLKKFLEDLYKVIKKNE